MNLNEEIPDEIVLLAECYKIFSDTRLASSINPFAIIMDDSIEFHNTGRKVEYSEALDKCVKLIKEFAKDKGSASTPPTTGRMFEECAITKPMQVPPEDIIKTRRRILADDLYRMYGIESKSDKTVMGNLWCKTEGIKRFSSNHKLYFIYQPKNKQKEG